MNRIVDTLDYKMHFDDVEAYIITLKGNATSERLSARCQQTCAKVEQPYHVWDAFDGTTGPIFYPDHAKDQDHYRFLKQMNDNKLKEDSLNGYWLHLDKESLPYGFTLSTHDLFDIYIKSL